MTASIQHLSLVEKQVKEYESEAESWKDDHVEATHCLNLEAIILLGLSAFEMICDLDESWRLKVFNGELEYDEDVDAAVRKLFETWRGPCPRVLKVVKHFERLGYDVTGAIELREKDAEAAAILADQAEFFGDRMADKRDEAVDQHRRGQAVEFKALGD